MAGLGTPRWLWGPAVAPRSPPRSPHGASRGHCQATVVTIPSWGPQLRQVVDNLRTRVWKWTVTPGMDIVTLSHRLPWSCMVPVSVPICPLSLSLYVPCP